MLTTSLITTFQNLLTGRQKRATLLFFFIALGVNNYLVPEFSIIFRAIKCYNFM